MAQPESQTSCFTPGQNLGPTLGRPMKELQLVSTSDWVGAKRILPPTPRLVQAALALTRDAYASKNIKYESASGNGHASKLLHSPGKWAQHLTHVWSNSSHLGDFQIGPIVHPIQVSHVEYCPSKTGQIDI